MSLSSLMSTGSSSSSPEKNFSSTESDPTSWRPYRDLDDDELTTWNKIRLRIFYVVTNPMFEFAVTAFIFLNTLVLSLEYHGMNPFFKQALLTLNHVRRILFLHFLLFLDKS